MGVCHADLACTGMAPAAHVRPSYLGCLGVVDCSPHILYYSTWSYIITIVLRCTLALIDHPTSCLMCSYRHLSSSDEHRGLFWDHNTDSCKGKLNMLVNVHVYYALCMTEQNI